MPSYKTNKKLGLISANLDTNAFKETDLKIRLLIASMTPEVNEKVTKAVFKDIEASGLVPMDTGNLQSTGFVMKDKYTPDKWLMRWSAPYAKKMYFGVNAQKDFIRDSGKTSVVLSFESGIPFWDRPFTGNLPYMLRLYNKEVESFIRTKKGGI